jgi:lipoate-protein ligase A
LKRVEANSISFEKVQDHAMHLVNLRLDSAAEYLAADEALLEACEAGQQGNSLWFWEPTSYFVVVGYANAVQTEVNTGFCEANEIPIFRRCTGGGTVLQGAGCLNYSLFLNMAENPVLETITGTNHFVMERHRTALSKRLQQDVRLAGHTDLAIDNLKFSGNAQRRRKDFILFHGCFLLSMDLHYIESCLRMPSRQPDYRKDRGHRDFITNLEVPSQTITECLAAAWNAKPGAGTVEIAKIRRLAAEKYTTPVWNYRF